MANIKRIDGKTGVSFKITVTKGRDLTGKQIRHFKTWRPDPKMTDRQMQKAVERVAMEFEQSIDLGFQADNRQTFAAYAAYVLDLKLRTGKLKIRTYDRYLSLLERVNQGIGHLKLTDIRPQHLNLFYQNLAEAGVKKVGAKATAKIDLADLLKQKNRSRQSIADEMGIGASTVKAAARGDTVTLSAAEAICKALKMPLNSIFIVEQADHGLADKTILEHHRLISSILTQAEKEMLIPYNAAEKATPPTASSR